MTGGFGYCCRTCGEWHEGMPTLAADAPLHYYSVPESERAIRCDLTSDTCIVDNRFFFLRGNIEIPVHGLEERFCWGVWVSISRENFRLLMQHWEDTERDRIGPFFGWLSADFRGYPAAENLKTNAHLQSPPWRPQIELEPTDHPLAIEQREGISQERLAQIYADYLHG